MKQPLVQLDNSIVVLIDLQQRLLAALANDVRESLIKQVTVLLQAANSLKIPVLATEQYPKGLGHTDPQLMPYITTRIVEKTCFSSADVADFMTQLTVSNKQQIVLVGMETHICILQTALALQAQGKQIFVMEDAVGSRTSQNKHNALQRLKQAGVIVSNTESVLFEWLRDANHHCFRELSKLIA